MVKITYIGNDMEFGAPLLITLGLIFTTWASTFVFYGLDNAFGWWLRDVIFIPITVTMFIILGATGLALFYGIKLNNPKLIRVWYIVKIVECVSILNVILCNIWQMVWGDLTALQGLLLIPCGIYLILCANNIYKNMVRATSVYQIGLVEPLPTEKV